MSNCLVNDLNRREIQERYVDSLIAHTDFITLRDCLRDYLHSEKNQYSNDDLYDEIVSRDHGIYEDVFNHSLFHVEVLS